MTDINKNFFELFGLPVACSVDVAKLSEHYLELQKSAHPDRFAGESAQQQRLSVEYASYINEGYETLRSPLKRLMYLLSLSEHSSVPSNQALMDPGFLMEQMTLREAVADIREQPDPTTELERLMNETCTAMEILAQQFEKLWDCGDQAALTEAGTIIQKMQFMEKLRVEIEQLETEFY